MKLGLALRELHRSETSMARRLRRVGERHRTDHDVYHLCGDLAGWSDRHVRELSDAGHRYGVRLSPAPARPGRSVAWLRSAASILLGRRPEPALLLLADLRSIHLHAAAVSIDWVLLAQGAQAARDEQLLALSARCHPDTLRQLQWAVTMVKELAPQTLLT